MGAVEALTGRTDAAEGAEPKAARSTVTPNGRFVPR